MALDLDIDLDSVLMKGGRRGAPTGHKRRDLAESDLHALANVKPGDLQQALVPIAKIRDTHHLLARLMAEGRKDVEIAKISGYSNIYLSNIKNDPAFKELVEYYRANVSEIYTSVHERMASVSMLAAEELQERLTIAPEKFTRRELLEVVEKTADRTGFGPKSTTVNINVDMATRLGHARRRAGLEVEHSSQTPMLDLQPIKESK